MDNKLQNIYNKYKLELIDYTYVDQENIESIPLGSYIRYISRNSLNKKSGFLKSIKDPTILELFLINKRKWFIYTDKYYIFYKIPKPNHSSLKSSLLELISKDFKILKIKK
jgi:hypothetical protein